MIQKTGGLPIDNSAILYLSQLQPNHTNTYRFTAFLTEPVCPAVLQKAADCVCARFPSIYAGFRPGFFSYSVVSAAEAPTATEDTGLLRTMSGEEIQHCAYRILYSGCEISIEAFHALTDGFGAMLSFRTLLAEYLFLRYGLRSPERTEVLENCAPDWNEELRDAYLDHVHLAPKSVPNRSSYQLPGKERNWEVKAVSEAFDTQQLLTAAKAYGVSLTAFLSCIMAESIMEVQLRESRKRRPAPVRIMVPVDLRKLAPSGTLRNFILYAMPTMEPEQAYLPRLERMKSFHRQLREQVSREYLLPQVSRNVRLQRSMLFRYIPRAVKCLIMQTVYGLFGERNSSITLTNLGTVAFSEEIRRYVRGVNVMLTPRRKSPYNCAVVSCGDTIRINITRFARHPDMEALFFQKLRNALITKLPVGIM